MRYFLLTLALLFCTPAVSQQGQTDTLVIDDQFQQSKLTSFVSYARAPASDQLSQVQVRGDWTNNMDSRPLAAGQSLWLRFSLVSHRTSTQKLAVSIENPALQTLDVYVLDNKSRILRSFLVGAQRSVEQRPFNHRHFVLPLEIEPAETLNVYVRVIDDGPMVLPVTLWRSDALIVQEQIDIAIVGMIGGALAILSCYFMITYVLLRSPIRFWFAVASLSLLILLFNNHGVLGQVTGITEYILPTTTILLAVIIVAAAKVAHTMLEHVPGYWRGVSYFIACGLLASALMLDSFWQIVVSSGLAGAAVFLQLLLALMFHNRNDSMPNRIYTLGWLIVSATAAVDVGLYLTGYLVVSPMDLLLSLLIMSGVLLIAVAIEAHEQSLVKSQTLIQQNTINNLRTFYDLFRNSAEGLYTSTMEGELLSTNPAMCNLFGYQDEQQMLSEVENTSQFYADVKDRDLLLGHLLEKGSVLGEEIKGVRRDGSEFWFSISVQIREEQNERFLYGSIFDVTERKQSSISLEYLATHDSLTGVYNRREFDRRLRMSLHRADRDSSPLTLLYMDLDQFKVVNDTCGHKAGDVLIKQLSQQLSDVVGSKGMLARLGGDEFGLLLHDENAEMAYLLANKLLNTVQEFRFIWQNRIFTLGVSIGLVHWHEDIKSTEQLLSMADAACYMAKEQGRNQIHTYSQEDVSMQRYETELNWVSEINTALEDDKFELYYQHYHPLTRVATGHHYEILLRMRDKNDELVLPNSFLPAAERYNLTAQIDKWVVEHYFAWLSEHPDHLQQLGCCNINLSGHSLADKDLRLFVLNAFEKYNIPYQKVCFEITESMAIVKIEDTLQFMKTFHQLGCSFALDDFGSGFSSYGYLKTLPVNLVKIDGSFVKDLLTDPIDLAMVTSIKDVAKAMGMRTVAEFVETKEIMVELGKIGVDYAQGYGVSKPESLARFTPYTPI